MFSEELSRNSSRKRAEENKARRRQLKEQQAKKTALAGTSCGETSQLQDVPPAILTATAVIPSTPNLESNVLNSPKLGIPPQGSTSNAEAKGMSAVERAEHERERRSHEARQTKAATTIQAFGRSYLSNAQVRTNVASLLERRLADLATLGKILHAKVSSTSASRNGGANKYVPPVATTTSFAQQLLFLSRSNPILRCSRDDRFVVRLPSSTWSPLLASYMELCIVPSLKTAQVSTNALVSWMDTVQGRLRLEGILRLSVIALFSPDTTSKCREVLTDFVRCLLKVSPTSFSPRELAMSVKSVSNSDCGFRRHCRSLLLLKAGTSCFDPPASSITPTLQAPCARQSVPLDLIANLRYYLMFVVAGSSMPIPSNAKDLRDKCISQSSKEVAGVLWSVVLDAVEASEDVPERQLLRCRIASNLLTVPLLAWKLCPTAVNAFVSPSDTKAALLNVVESFVETHSEVLTSGSIQLILEADDVTLTICPATPLQCLLANLVQFAVVCPTVNGSDAHKMNSPSATLFFTFLCTILDTLPLPTFSSRDSSVEWMTDGKGQHTPIVLSSVILDQCKLIMLDSFVRRFYQCSITSAGSLDLDAALGQKNERDLKHEKSLLESGAASASSLAAKEARIDRSVGFWNSSKWARKISKGVSSMLSGEAETNLPPVSSPSRMKSNADSLVNTTSISRLLARGKQKPPNSSEEYAFSFGKGDSNLFIVFCRLYGIILCRWGGGGHDGTFSTISKTSDTLLSNAATSTAETCTMSLLNVLGFSTQVLKSSWAMIQSNDSIRSEVDAIVDADGLSHSILSLSMRPSYERLRKSSEAAATDGSSAILLYMFVATFAHVLIVTDDVELHDMERPLPIHQVRRCVEVLKKLLYRATYLEDRTDTTEKSNYFGRALVSASSRTMRDLYDRSSRRPICVPKLWLVPDLFEKEIRRCKSCSDFLALLSHPVLRVCPFLVSFKRRLKLFERIVTTNRIEVQGVNDLNPFNPNPLKPGIPVRIMRGRLLEDGLATMNHLGSNMRRRIAVQYVNEAGMQETGIDAGGLFKEFWTDLSAIAFNPNYALFRVTEGAGNCLYPNPSSGAAHGSDHVVLFEFLGRILGKALYEGITINPRFAHFFLSFLRGDYNYLHMLPDLSTVDPQLYSNLMFLKNYEGDATDLSLTFTVTSEEFGGTREIPLVPNGANIDVTSSNKQRYIGLVAKHYVVDRVREQSVAFTRGLWEVIDRSWLRIFNEPELQVLISGTSDGKIDVEDLRANTKYAGGYSSLDRNVARFWSVVASLDSTQQQSLLRFVTSCERPPPLGFASMNPAFTIQRVGLTRDDGKLPAASTCFNILKLPIYSSDKVMKERLLYAIQSGAGFELT